MCARGEGAERGQDVITAWFRGWSLKRRGWHFRILQITWYMLGCKGHEAVVTTNADMLHVDGMELQCM